MISGINIDGINHTIIISQQMSEVIDLLTSS